VFRAAGRRVVRQVVIREPFATLLFLRAGDLTGTKRSLTSLIPPLARDSKNPGGS
jgi:hypothetical protein